MFKEDVKKIYGFSRKVMFAFFAVTVCALVTPFVRGLNMGIDFAGGVVFDFSIKHDNINLDDVTKRVGNVLKGEDFSLQSMGEGRFLLKMASPKTDQEGSVVKTKSSISHSFDAVEFHQVESIGPQVSKGLVKHGVYAVLFSFVTIILYLLIRFNVPFALSGVLVLLCNIVFVLGIVSVFGIEVNLTMVAAFLTIIGYCINDTVVLYDRIRTNAVIMSQKPIWESVSISISQMFRRSIITSVVTMLAVVGIMFFSDSGIRNFAIILMCGIVFGTIGSVFVASILPIFMGLKKQQLVKG